MSKTKRIRKIFTFLLDLLEIYIPIAAFSVMFCVFLLQVLLRYIFNAPLSWPYEVTLICFIWAALLGACLARRLNAHVAFGMVYDVLSPQRQLIFRLAGNGIIIAAFCIALYPSLAFIAFISFQKSAVLRIPLSLAYSPFVVFLLLILGRTVYDTVSDLKKLIQAGP
ncbi:MAG: hypothetical protein A3F83_01535 [Candidatus Glassbacteria bacterium RIFCSPLOWO2_12_FULL_58_11]|uniref:Tripartite ATP-independent periplasmic transporters DctQ component domain-containing protein n=1 Tax=Candidatus Glassbacteria bacterium RIFCSPLOWO2_12_FULL_58_11 TaxID=1817867 RepID=A0A1F5YV40_9BACT|nr:MAG: hypothetical protein A3F83_01535 [Candidatus Glassbacteria bacterium RIFCSPLOWO2_12_FULL_58_11]